MLYNVIAKDPHFLGVIDACLQEFLSKHFNIVRIEGRTESHEQQFFVK